MKHRLADYLHLKNIEFKRGFYRCPNPGHNDTTISNCKCYDNTEGQVLTCFVCGENWDIFDVAGLLIGSSDFLTQKKEVESVLGVIDTSYEPKPKHEKPKEEYIPIWIEKIDEIYDDEKILSYAIEKEYGNKITGKYICFDKIGEKINAIEYRFENDGKKTPFLIWYNGKSIKWTNPPRLIFGLNEIVESKPYLIVEGPKTREIASNALPEFNVLTWNGGANNAGKVPWAEVIPDDADVYLFGDDDEAGQVAMNTIEEMLR